jgi:outer membrane protein, adhesin transport system
MKKLKECINPLARIITAVFIISISLSVTTGVAGESGDDFPLAEPNLTDDLSKLLSIDHRIIAAKASLEAAGSGYKQAFSVFLPRLSLSSDAGKEVIDSPSTRLSGLDEQRETREKATLTLTQNLFSGGANTASYNISGKQVDLAGLGLETTKNSVLLEGLIAYFSLERDKKLLDLALRAEAFTKKQLKLENERVEKGQGVALDILQAKGRLQLAAQRRIQFQGQLDVTTTQFTYLFRFRPVLPAGVETKFEMPALPRSLDEALKIALENSPALAAAQATVDVTKIGIDSAEAGFWPKVDLEATSNYERDAGGVEGIRRDWSVLLKVSWTLFDGFGSYHGARSARSNYAASMSQFDASKRQVKTELISSFQRFKNAEQNKALMENGLRIAEEIVSAQERMEKAGKETAINTLDAESQLIDAKINYTSAYYNHLLGGFSVMTTMGVLTPENLGVANQ